MAGRGPRERGTTNWQHHGQPASWRPRSFPGAAPPPGTRRRRVTACARSAHAGGGSAHADGRVEHRGGGGWRSLIRDDWRPNAGLFCGSAWPCLRAVREKCGSGGTEAPSTVAWCSSGCQRAAAYLGHRSLSFLSAPNGYGK